MRDGARRARVPARRGHRRLRRRLQGDRRPASIASAPRASSTRRSPKSAIVGAAVGAGYMGMRPVAEMQFMDFVELRVRHDHQLRREEPVSLRPRRAAGRARAVRRRRGRRAVSFREPRSVVPQHARPADRRAGDRVRREGPARRRRFATTIRCSCSSTSSCTGVSRTTCRRTTTSSRSAGPRSAAQAPTRRSSRSARWCTRRSTPRPAGGRRG